MGIKKIPQTRDEAVEAAEMLEGEASETAERNVVEEKMQAKRQASCLWFAETNISCFPASQDHKRVGEGDTGLNTGGMGAYAPAAA